MAQISITFDPADVGEIEVAQRILATISGTNKADREFGQPHHGHDARPVAIVGNDDDARVVFGANAQPATGPVTVVAADPTPGHAIPAPPALPPPGAAAAPDKDAKGVPWDARIHASSKEKNKDGTWRVKRGADKAEVARILAEITPMALPPASPPMPPIPPVPPAAPPAAPVSVPAGAPVASGVPASADAPVNPFVELMQHVMLQVRSSKITNAEVMECAGKFGIVRLDELSAKVELIPQVRAAIDAVTFGR